MNYEKNLQSDKHGAGPGVCAAIFVGALLWLCTALVLLLGSGCITRTVAPKPIVDSTASFSPETGKADSGIIGWHTNAAGVTLVEVTPSYRARYNAMIPIYGKSFLPPLQPDQGITPHGSNYLITLDGASKFAKMNRARKAAGP